MRNLRNIKYIVVHCTATQPGATVEAIRRYWKEKLGWNNPGYHFIIQRDGEVVQLLEERRIANGVKGYNRECVHLSYIGGVDKDGKPADNRTAAQKEAMFDLVVELAERYPDAQICGHRDFPGVKKACPSFDVQRWLSDYEPNLDMAA